MAGRILSNVAISQGAIAMEAIAALTALGWKGTIDGSTVVTAILAVAGVVGGTTVAVHASQASSDAQQSANQERANVDG